MIMEPCVAGLSAPMNGFRVDDQFDFYQNIGNGFKFEEPIEDLSFVDLPLLPSPPYANSCGVPVAPPPAPMNGFRADDDQSDFYQDIGNGFKFEEPIEVPNIINLPLLPPPYANSYGLPVAPPSGVIHEADSPEDCVFSDCVLNYINQVLMEEDMEEKTCMLQEFSALEAAEKPFYEILGQKYPPSPDGPPLYYDLDAESPKDHFTSTLSNSSGTSGSTNTHDSCLISDLGEFNPTRTTVFPADSSSQSSSHSPVSTADNSSGPQSSSHSPLCSSDGVNNSLVDGFVESPMSEFQVVDILTENESVAQFRRGLEEASKFLPNGNDLIFDLEKRGVLHRREPKEGLPRSESKEEQRLPVKVETKDEIEYSPTEGSKGRKHQHGEEPELELVRSNKQSAVYMEEAERTEMFDIVLLSHPGGKGESSLDILRRSLKNEVSKNGKSNVSSGGKTRGKKQVGKKEVVDLSTLLMHCAQAVSTEDRRSVNELLKQIRQHSTPSGDGNQRLAHYFADGIEARMAGTGMQLYTGNSSLRKSAANVLRAYHLYLAFCPFKKVSYLFSAKTIMNLADKATRLHIVDFGISYGFQWPSFIQILSTRPGGPPKLHITGIECPQPGFRPSSMVEETGRRLANYAKTFNVPFEFTAIAQKWETIQLEDLKIDCDEVLVVNCLYRLNNLMDETVVVDSPRDAVLNLIKRMKPDVFIHGVSNGAFSAPFFVTRFREALFHYSALFDMLEANVPREVHERMLIERDIFSRSAINVISCEGSERLERPETYKQWQVRNLRAGLKQLPLNPDMVKVGGEKVKAAGFHKDFGIDQDGHWILQTWKGRILYAVSLWRSAYDS